MATVNFLLTSPIAVDCDMDVAEIKVVSRVNELFQELQRIPGVRVAMSDIGYADGMDYCAIVSVKINGMRRLRNSGELQSNSIPNIRIVSMTM